MKNLTNVFYQKIVLLLILLQVFFLKANAQGPPTGTGTWTQTFNEDFSAITMASDRKSFTTSSGNTWITTFYWGNGSIGDGSLNYYSGNNVASDGSNLVLTVRNELALGQHPFTGGLANTDPAVGGSFSQLYGYYELRVKISMTNGDASYAGVPPNSHTWPPEVEMFESPYAWSKGGQMVHFLSKLTGCDGAVVWDSGTPAFMPNSFHTIGMLWQSDVVVFYIDGIERGRTTCVSHEPGFLNIGHGCGSDGGSWNGDAYAGTWPQSTLFDYFRVWTKDGSGTTVFVAPAAPTAISGPNKLAVSWRGSIGATSYNVKRSTTSGSGYTTIASVSTPNYIDNNVINGTTYYYVVSAVKPGQETKNSSEASSTPMAETNGTKLIGYGTVSGETYGGWEGYKAFDGKTDTGFDYIVPNGGQTGIDLGSGKVATLTKIRFFPRGGFEGRMTGGKFQGSNDNITFNDIYIIPSIPVAGWNEVNASSTAFRYFRYFGPVDGYGDVNEIEFYGNSVVSVQNKLSGTTFGTTPAWSTGSEFDKAFDGNTSTFFDYLNSDGGYTGIDVGTGGATVSKIKFFPRAGYESRMNGGKFQGSNTSSTAGFTDIYTITTTPATTWVTVDVSTVSYRYLRYLSPTGSYGNVAEIEFYGVLSSPAIETELSRTGWIASSSVPSGDGPSNAIDGNQGSRFSPDINQASGQWWAVNFGSAKSLSRIQVDYSYWPQDYMRGYAVYTSTDGINWGTPIITGSGTSSSANTSIVFPLIITTQYLKIQLTQSVSGNWFTIAEFHAYTTGSGARLGTNVNKKLMIKEEPENKVEEELQVYPVPTSGILNVKFVSSESKNLHISLRDILGKMILDTFFKANEGINIYTLNISTHPPGIYFLSVENGKINTVKKIIIN